MTIYLLVFLAASVLLLLIYKYDMYDREPWFMMLLAIFLGGLSAWLVGDAEDWAIIQTGAFESIPIQAAIASSFEETSKLLVVLIIAFGFRRWFNDPMDGIVYGALRDWDSRWRSLGSTLIWFCIRLRDLRMPTCLAKKVFG